jgi:NADH-quinone oxidoreductase subunit M
MSAFPHITALTLLPFVGGVAVLLLGSRSAARLTTALFATAAVLYTLLLWHGFDPALPYLQWQEVHAWAPSMGLQYHVGVDGLSLVMLAVS